MTLLPHGCGFSGVVLIDVPYNTVTVNFLRTRSLGTPNLGTDLPRSSGIWLFTPGIPGDLGLNKEVNEEQKGR